MFIIFIAPPGSGKDTQADLLADRKGYRRVTTGGLFREEIAKSSKLGQQVEQIVNGGGLVDDETLAKVFCEYAKSIQPTETIVLTGTPRSKDQVAMLDKVLASQGHELAAAVYLHVPKQELLQRFAGRLYSPSTGRTYHEKFNPPRQPGIDDVTGEPLITRPDDQPQAVERRLKLYAEITEPVLDIYRHRGILKEIDGVGDVEEVYQRVATELS